MEYYGFKSDIELLASLPEHELHYTIDFGGKHLNKEVEQVVLTDFKWFVWTLQNVNRF